MVFANLWPHRYSVCSNESVWGNTSGQEAREYKFFTPHRASQSGELDHDRVDTGQLFCFAVGCLPTSNNKGLCFDDAENVTVGPAPLQSGTSDFVEPGISPAVQIQRVSHVHFKDGFSDSSSASDDSSERLAVRSPVAYVTQSNTRTVIHHKKDPWMPRAFQLSIFMERSENLLVLQML